MDSKLAEEQLSKPNELTEVIVDQTSEVNQANNNLVSEINNTSETQSQQQDVAVNMGARFGPSCARVLSSTEIVNNIIERSKRADRQRWLYLFVGCIPPFIVTCLIWIIWATISCEHHFYNNCEAMDTLHYTAIGLTCATVLIFFWAIYYGAKHYTNENSYEILRNNVRHLIKLEGEQWVRYVNYLYGSDRTDFTYLGAVGACTFCCCRRPHYQQLIERGYGYIVLCKHGFLLDEMYSVVRDRTHMILKVIYVLGMGLRVYVLRCDAKAVVRRTDSQEERAQKVQSEIISQTVPLDIYLPDTLTETTTALLGLQIQYGF